MDMFHHQQREIHILVHGDDFVPTGDRTDLEWMKKSPEDRFAITTQTLGPGEDQEKEVGVPLEFLESQGMVGNMKLISDMSN